LNTFMKMARAVVSQDKEQSVQKKNVRLRDAYAQFIGRTVVKAWSPALALSNLTLQFPELDGLALWDGMSVTAKLTNTDGTEITLEKYGELNELNAELHKRGLHALFYHPVNVEGIFDEPHKTVNVVFVDLAQCMERIITGYTINSPETVVKNLHLAGWLSSTYPFWVVKAHASHLNDTLKDGVLPDEIFKFLKTYVKENLNMRLLGSMFDKATETLTFAYCPKYIMAPEPIFEADIRWQLACIQGELDMMRMDAPEAMRDAIRQVIQGLRFCKSLGEFVKHCECSGIGTDFIPPYTMVGNGLQQNITKDLEAAILYSAMVRPIFTSSQERLKETAGMSVDLVTGNWTTTYEYEGLLESLRYMIKSYERNTRHKFFKE